MTRKAELPPRFWAKVDKRPGHGPAGKCWVWTGAKTKDGYGSFGAASYKTTLAHRAVYMALHGHIEGCDGFNGTVIRHTCDNPSCVNPAHLRAGHGWDNQNDKVAKRRHAFGVRHTRAVLDDGLVRKIRRTKGTNAEVAVRFGVSASTISYVKNRKSWAHVH